MKPIFTFIIFLLTFNATAETIIINQRSGLFSTATTSIESDARDIRCETWKYQEKNNTRISLYEIASKRIIMTNQTSYGRAGGIQEKYRLGAIGSIYRQDNDGTFKLAVRGSNNQKMISHAHSAVECASPILRKELNRNFVKCKCSAYSHSPYRIIVQAQEKGMLKTWKETLKTLNDLLSNSMDYQYNDFVDQLKVEINRLKQAGPSN